MDLGLRQSDIGYHMRKFKIGENWLCQGNQMVN